MSESQKLKAVNKDRKIRKERNMKDRNSILRKERGKTQKEDRNSKQR